ncbi:hypothetical protein BL240_21050 [Pseudomonas putida]|uniref:Uncharacterized protein n=1 Tax=Pseudomonas putida TaxID=303 RepID=A0A1L5PZ82_PSEPU|nr:hypothetical protein BL240_21050 [Pseudomonas putida]
MGGWGLVGIEDLLIGVACAGLFAGLPAPTGSPQILKLCGACGSGQAREEAGTGKHCLRPEKCLS